MAQLTVRFFCPTPLVCSVHSALPSLAKRRESQSQSWGEDALCSLVSAPKGHSFPFSEALPISSRCLAHN